MALDLEEQEQLAELKAWWKQNGTLVISVILAAAIGFAGWQGWKWYQRNQAAQASALYDTLVKGAQTNEGKSVRDATGALIESYPRTLYASMGALVAAKYHFDKNDLKAAKLQLQWVIDRSPSDEFRDLARLRLGAVLIDEKAYDEAIKVAEAKHAPAFDGQFAALKGDALVAKNQKNEAKDAYKVALEKGDAQDNAFRESVRMRLEALGG